MRILLASPYDLTHPGGVTSHVFDLAHQFQEMGHSIVVAGPAGNGRLPQNGYTHHLGATMRFLSPGDSARVNINPFMILTVRAFLAEHQFDVLHLHEPFIPFIGPSFLRLADGLKIGTFHTWREGPHLPYLAFWPLIAYWNRMLDGRVAVSPAAHKTISRYFPGEYKIIPNGVNFERFAAPARPPCHLVDERPTVLFVGRIEARKGIPYLLNAFKLVKKSIPSARLVIVGEGGLRAEYIRLAREMALDDVSFEGFVEPERLTGYYHRADVFCSSSTVNESFGITLLEAMAACTPVVATTINGLMSEADNEKLGLVVPPRDAQALAGGIVRLLEDRQSAERLAEAAQARARCFDWANVATQLIDYYKSLGA